MNVADSEINVVKHPLTGKTIFEIFPADLTRAKAKSNLSFDSSDYLAPFIQQLPALFAAKELGSAYKLVFPPGVVGDLLKHVNNPHLRGMSMSSVVQSNGIVAHAGFDKISYLQAPLIGFVIASAVTGQYFQAKTEKALRVIVKDLEKIAELILADKEANLRSIYHFSEHVKENIAYIKFNEQLRDATLINVQRNNIEVFSLMKFYEKNIHNELDDMCKNGKDIKSARINYNDEVKSLLSNVSTVSNYMERHQICLDLYMIGSISEVQLASAYDEDYLNNLKTNLNILQKKNSELIDHARDIHKDCFSISRVRDDKTIEIGKIEMKMREFETRKTVTDRSILDLVNGVNGITDLNRDGMECIYSDKQLYLVGKTG